MKDKENKVKESAHNQRRPLISASKVRSINPLGMRVVIKICEEDNQTDSGLYLPEGAKENHQESLLAEVIEVASAHDDETDEEHNISGIPEGALVLIQSDAGVCVPWDDTIRIVETHEVLALVIEDNLI